MNRKIIESLQRAIRMILVMVLLTACGTPAATSGPSTATPVTSLPTATSTSVQPTITFTPVSPTVTSTSALPTDVAEPLGQDDARTFEEILVSANEYRLQRDLAGALAELALAELMIEDRSSGNHEYLLFLLVEADTYAWFDLLDEAEAALLRATGIPNECVDLISDSRNPLSEEGFLEIADEIQQLVSQTDLSGYHVALSLIYNILGDEGNLRREQQAAMDVSVDQDMTLSIAMGLYKVRGRKIEVHSALEQQILRVEQEPDDWAEQYQLALLFHQAGWLPEAQEIIDRYLLLLDPENDEEAYLYFLFLKMNLEMSLGHYEAMKECEAKILSIDPHALDEFSE
jgi:tetratricopeptide (TPR) repeat protein